MTDPKKSTPAPDVELADLQQQKLVADTEELFHRQQLALSVMRKNRLDYLVNLRKVEADIIVQERAVADKQFELDELKKKGR